MLDLTVVPKLDVGSVECLNFILLHPTRRVIKCKHQEGQIELILSSKQSFSNDGIASIICDTPLGILTIVMDIALVDALSDLFINCWRRPEATGLPFEWRAIAALEIFIHQTAFSAMPCKILKVLRFEYPQDGRGMLFGQALIDGQEYGVGMAIQNGVLTEFAKYLGQPPALIERKLHDFEVQLQPKMQGPTLSCKDVLRMEAGDIIILPFCSPQDLKISLEIGAQYSWSGQYDLDGQFTVTKGGAYL